MRLQQSVREAGIMRIQKHPCPQRSEACKTLVERVASHPIQGLTDWWPARSVKERKETLMYFLPCLSRAAAELARNKLWFLLSK